MPSKSFFLTLAFVFSMISISVAKTELRYTVSFPEPHTHYLQVAMDIEGIQTDFVDVKMPIWAPGSYLAREFARHIEGLEAIDNEKTKLKAEKIRKNTWRISGTKNKNFTINYKVYAYELTVRTSFVDERHAYLNGSSVFLYIDKQMDLPATIKIIPNNAWKQISTSLDLVNAKDPNTFASPNYDILADSPFEIGNHSVYDFVAMNVPHQIAMFGDHNADIERLKKDIIKIVESSTKIFGEHPCKKYLFIIHNIAAGGGGLEHLNSTTCQVNQWAYKNETTYTGILQLLAHEYFHLWNVKRLRPIELGPFDYDNENYTHNLWVAEGFTAYYEDVILRRAGITTDNFFMATVVDGINSISNTRGNYVQPLAEASFDAWIKYYRPNENSNNSTISYYTKGAAVAAMLDMEIINQSNGSKNLDNVMQYLYQTYYKGKNRGFTDGELLDALSLVTQKNMTSFVDNFIYDTQTIDFATYFQHIGLNLKNTAAGNADPYLGMNIAPNNKITFLTKNTASWKSGLNVNDEIIAVDGYRFGGDLAALVRYKKTGDELEFLVARDTKLKTIKVKLEPSGNVRFELSPAEKPTEQQTKNLKKYLNG